MSRNQVSPCDPFAPVAPLASFAKASRVFLLLILFCALIGGSVLSAQADTITFTAEELLGKPTNNSVTINIVPGSAIQYKYEYGIASGTYTGQTSPVTAVAGQPSEVTITGLTANTRYYYRMVYDGDGSVGDSDYETRPEHSFMTARAKGEDFTFTVTSDSHGNFGASTATNILAGSPDFNVDLGDTFMSDTLAENQTAYNNQYITWRGASYFGGIGQSVPIFLATGNHEEEEGWNFDDTPSRALLNIEARKLYFPHPTSDGFYTGNADTLASLGGDQLREDYYAWEWGDALFVVIDPFQYTPTMPYTAIAGEESDETVVTDQWLWTLGAEQYAWLKQTLESSTARYKFMFSHQMVGGVADNAVSGGAGYVRGGAEAAGYFEWGGKNFNGTEGFADHRDSNDFPAPIHQLMVENGVSAYFHGHDHQYVYETRDGIVYQEVPSPSMTGSGFTGIYAVGTYADYETVAMCSNAGHLRVTVASDQATVQYVRAGTGTCNPSGFSLSYTIAPNTPVATHDLTMAVNPEGTGTTTPEVGTHARAENSVVNISATPALGYAFSSWTGDVANANSASTTVTMDADKTVTANFTTVPTYALTTAVSPAGTGTISPASGEYNQGDVVNVTATPNTGYAFASWSGACTGTDPCSLTMDAAKSVTALFEEAEAGSVTLDGAVSSGTADGASSISFAHTTGTGVNRLMLVGVSSNSYNGAQTISSVDFTPSGGSALALSLVGSQENESGRLVAIYSLLNPPSGAVGTVTITYGGSVSYGIVAGAANFAGVNQADPLDDFASAVGSGSGTSTVSVDVSSDVSDFVFDTVFLGGSPMPTATTGAGQTQLWNATIDRARGAASTEEATTTITTMSWSVTSASGTYYWAIAAVPINPAAAGTTYNLTMATDGNGTTNPAVGVHIYAENTVVPISTTPNSGYVFSSWTGDADCADGSVTMTANKTCTANFTPVGTEITFTGEELLGRPTDTSISVKVVPDASISLYYEYGTTPGLYTGQTDTVAAAAGAPTTVVMGCLSPDTKYYYRMRYSADGGTSWVSRPENSFWTQRSEGSTFKFTITSDSHVNILLGDADIWESTLNDVAADQPDFHLDLGDTFDMRSLSAGNITGAENSYKYQLPFFNIVSHSAPIFLAPGNHEQQEAWHQIAGANSLNIIGTNAQKKFFLNPVPDGSFYTGDTSTNTYLTGDQLKEDYYAWAWGDALFVVINPYWYTTTKPYTSDLGGGETDTTGSGDAWDWTLGEEQFNWLKATLESSSAKYKFIFSHQMVSDASLDQQEDYGHAGANHAQYVEWGGYDEDGTAYGWGAERGGWGSDPVHQILVKNGVSAFFHGHDHQYAYESRDGVVYQAVPSAGFTGDGFGMYTTGNGYTIQALDSSGHLRVTVDPSQTTVDYIMTGETSSEYSYAIQPPGGVTLDGAVSSNTADDVSSISFSHTTGSGTNPMMLVGVSWNCGSTNRTISSVKFTPSGGSAVTLTPVITQQAGTQLRYSAIYRWPAGTVLPSGQAGTVAVTFSGSVSDGIVAGAANFAGVNQTTPLGTAAGAGATSQGTAPSVTLTGLGGTELVFDNVFQGASSSSQTLTAGAGQSQLWNAYVGSTRDAASTEKATGSSVTMSWTAASSSWWAIAAVPIKPATASSYDLTIAVDPVGVGTTSPTAGVHPYAPAAVVPVTATPGAGYVFSHWTGACTGSGACSITMNADKSVTAHFTVSVDVTISKSGSNPKLDWPHLAALVDSYAVYRSLTDPYFVLSNASRLPDEVSKTTPTFTDTAADLSVAGNMYFYLVGPVNECGGACGSSNRTGAWVYGLVPGSSTP